MNNNMYLSDALKKAIESLDLLYYTAWDYIIAKDELCTKRTKTMLEMSNYLRLALEAFESIKSCKYAPCEQCVHFENDDSIFCGDGCNFKWKYAEQVKDLLKEK